MQGALVENCKVLRHIEATVAGTGAVNGTTIDTAGYDGVMFVLCMGAITAGAATSVKAQQGAASDLSDAADLAGTGITIADDADDTPFVLDIYRPRERYLRAVVSRATQNSEIESCIAILYRGSARPDAQAGLTDHELHVSPAEGTA